MSRQGRPEQPREGVAFLRRVLGAAGPRPSRSDEVAAKTKYATRFADAAGRGIAHDLLDRLENISSTTKKSARSVHGRKQLDVSFSTPELGLALGISLKSVHVRDVGSGGKYTHNRKRNEEELRIEASGYHKRQPYAVMVAVLFLPFDSADDGKGKNASSFGAWVRHLRPYAGREGPGDEVDKFEKIYIGLYEPDGTDLRFFDILDSPPKKGRPTKCLDYRGFLADVYHAYLERNEAEFKWADGSEEPLDVEDQVVPEDEDT